MAGYSPEFREVARLIARTAHLIMMCSCDEPLDGDNTEELSVMFREEMDLLNGNITEEEYDELTSGLKSDEIKRCEICNKPEDDDGNCGCTAKDY